MNAPNRDDAPAGRRQKRARSYQVTLEFSTTDEPDARSLMQRLIGVMVTSGVEIREWSLADITRGNYRSVAEGKEPRKPKSPRKRTQLF